MRSRSCLILLMLFTAIAVVRAQTAKIDGTNVFTELTSLVAANSQQDDTYLTGKKFTVSSKSTKNMSKYDADFTKYKTTGSLESYTVVTVKGRVIETLYITYDKAVYQKTLDAALNAGFAEKQPATPGSSQTMYAKDNLRFLVLQSSANDKTFYTLGISDLTATMKAIEDSKNN